MAGPILTGQLLLLALYSGVLIALGLWIGRRVRTTGGFFVADRSLGPGLLFATLLAANIGAGSTVGAAALGYRDGWAAWWWVGSAGIGTILLGAWLGPRVWRLAQRHRLKTVGDLLELRYGRWVRFTIGLLLWFGTLAILASQLIALAWILEVVAGVPKVWGCIVGGAVMTAYFTAGGLLTSAWVNLLELVVLWIGFLVALPLALAVVGGVDGLAAAEVDTWHGFLDSGGSGWGLLFLLVPAFLVSPGLLQKIYGARDERTVRRGVLWSGVALLLFAALPPLLGMVARVGVGPLAADDLALPTVLTQLLPLGIGTLGLAAVLSAEISSADAILFMLSTSLSEDLYRGYLRPGASDREILRVARIAAVLGGVLGIALALLLPSVIAGMRIFYSLLGVSLFVPVVAAVHTRLGGQAEALLAIGAGIAVRLALAFDWLDSPWQDDLTAILASACVFLLAVTIWRRPGPLTETEPESVSTPTTSGSV